MGVEVGASGRDARTASTEAGAPDSAPAGWHTRRMDVDACLAALRREGESFAAAAARADPDAPVPTCPDWGVRDLIRHVGGVHRWAATVVRERRTEPLGLADPVEIVDIPPGDATMVEWFRAGHADLLEVLAAADRDVACWSFLPAPSPLEFWARREAHETAIHRVDAELTGGTVRPFPVEHAVDGIDELLCAFVAGRSRKLRSENVRTFHVRTTDADAEWLVTTGPDHVDATRGGGPADCALRGPASDLYRLLWNRRSTQGLDITGDQTFLDTWRGAVRVRWA